MKEQSHKDEMSAALRGDFERLRERGVATALAPAEHSAEPVAQSEPPVEKSRDDAAIARPGLLGRLLGR